MRHRRWEAMEVVCWNSLRVQSPDCHLNTEASKKLTILFIVEHRSASTMEDSQVQPPLADGINTSSRRSMAGPVSWDAPQAQMGLGHTTHNFWSCGLGGWGNYSFSAPSCCCLCSSVLLFLPLVFFLLLLLRNMLLCSFQRHLHFISLFFFFFFFPRSSFSSPSRWPHIVDTNNWLLTKMTIKSFQRIRWMDEEIFPSVQEIPV